MGRVVLVHTLDSIPFAFSENGMIIAGGGSGSGIMKGDAIGRVASAVYSGKDKVKLYNNIEFNVADVGVNHRNVKMEQLIL